MRSLIFLSFILFSLEVFSAELRDPTLPLVIEPEEGESKTEKKEILLTGIVISGNKKRAILNNKIFKEGDKIEGMQIIKIEKDKIILKNERGEKIIPLFGNSIKGERK